MDSDRSWMQIQGVRGRQQEAYRKGVREFLDFAFKDTPSDLGTKLRCPCVFCQNYFFHDRETIRIHLFQKGIKPDYNPWIHHGEEASIVLSDEEMYEEEVSDFDEEDALISGEMADLVYDATNVADQPSTLEGRDEFHDETPNNFHRLMKIAEEELYPGCKTYSKLEFIITLLHLKVSGRWSEKSFTGLLSSLHRAFNYDPSFPKSSEEAKKYTKDLGLNYTRIHACVNHCVLYRKELANADSCPICNEPRWEEGVGDVDDSAPCSESQGASHMKPRPRIPRLVLRYFPVATRFQRLFMSPKTATHMRWHKEKRQDDGILRHPADSMAWKELDEMYPDFAADPRNVRLGLATDGFNPGAHLSSKYSIWPVFLVPYNLPPWMCMKSPYLMLSLLIPGSKAPGNDIDVFLEPMIDDLKELWEVGVETYDSHSRKKFNMKVVLIWTISDYPAYANLSGWSTSGKLACPSCHKETWYKRLEHGNKYCFLGHRRFLDPDHKWRTDKKSFNGERERQPPPIPLSGDEVLEALHGFTNVIFGKKETLKRKRGQRYLVDQWKKRSIFFRLPYWSKLLIRHNLDVMHIQKNICESIIGTLLDIPGKTKDGLSARLDLEKLNMHEKLRPIKIDDKYHIPVAPYQLTLAERKQVSYFLSKVKVPDGYSSNIARCASLKDGKIADMKSHDCHIFMQDLLTPAFRGILPKEVLEPLAELGTFFKQLCSKSLSVDVLDKLEKSIAVTLCKLERIFVPSFFDIMVHLSVHLATEAKLAGPVQFRWMYRFEREMRTLKSYVRNKARPEGSIAEAYIMDECLTFCSRYLSGVETKFNRMDRNDMDEFQPLSFELSIFRKKGNPLGKRTFKQLNYVEWKQAQLYVLRNCLEVQPFMQEFESLNEVGLDFVDWFKSRISRLHIEGDPRATKELLSLAQGPSKSVSSYQGYFVHGCRFHTKKRQRKRKTQNSGVVVKGDEESGERDFFGVLKEVIELEYDALDIGRKQPVVVLFRCAWYDVYRDGYGIKRDKFGTISVNIRKLLGTNEPFALASQVAQVYYVRAHNEPDWRVVIKTIPHNFYYFPVVEDDASDDEHEDVGILENFNDSLQDDQGDNEDGREDEGENEDENEKEDEGEHEDEREDEGEDEDDHEDEREDEGEDEGEDDMLMSLYELESCSE